MLIRQLLNETAMTPLYRGVRTRLENGERVKFTVRTNRNPLDSPALGAMLVDFGIELVLGVENIRRRCVFATTNWYDASGYGDIIELELSPDTPCVYHPDMNDSVELTSLVGTPYASLTFEPEEEPSPFAAVANEIVLLGGDKNHLANERRVLWGFSDEQYQSNEHPLVKLKNHLTPIVQDLAPDRMDLVDKALRAFEETARLAAKGFVKSTVGAIPPAERIEVMLYGISEYTGVCVNDKYS